MDKMKTKTWENENYSKISDEIELFFTQNDVDVISFTLNSVKVGFDIIHYAMLIYKTKNGQNI